MTGGGPLPVGGIEHAGKTSGQRNHESVSVVRNNSRRVCVGIFLRSSGAIRAENLVLRKQLVSYIERRINPRRLDHATRVSLALFTRRERVIGR